MSDWRGDQVGQCRSIGRMPLAQPLAWRAVRLLSGAVRRRGPSLPTLAVCTKRFGGVLLLVAVASCGGGSPAGPSSPPASAAASTGPTGSPTSPAATRDATFRHMVALTFFPASDPRQVPGGIEAVAAQMVARAAHLHLPARVFVEGDSLEVDISGPKLSLEEQLGLTRVNPAGEQPLPLILNLMAKQGWTWLNPPASGTPQLCPRAPGGPLLQVSNIPPNVDLRTATGSLQQSSAEVWVLDSGPLATSQSLLLRFPGLPLGDWTDRSTPLGAVAKDVIAATGAPPSQVSSSLFRQVC